jgi:hypothetical protein
MMVGRYSCDPGRKGGSVTIVAYRPVQEVEDLLGGQRITEVQLVDGNVETHLNYNGQPRKFTEEPWQVFGALRVEGATLAGAELRGNRLAGDGVDYGVEDGGRPDVVHETEAWVPEGLRILGARLANADLDAGDVVYSLAAA